MDPAPPLESLLRAPLRLVTSVWIEVNAPDWCGRPDCTAVRFIPVRLLLAEGLARPDDRLNAVLRRLRCRKCHVQPGKLALLDRADGKGWRVGVPPTGRDG